MVADLSALRHTISALVLPRLRPDQSRIAWHPSKRKYLAMGRRWGKTTMAGSLGLAAAAVGGKVAWVSPTYKNSRPLWRFAEQHCRPLDGTIRILRAEQVIEMPGGGFLSLFSGENATGIRGWDFDLVIVDEAATVDEETITDVIEPTLADRDGEAYYIGTPKGRNWFWRGWMDASTDESGYSHAWTAPTSDNPIPAIQRAADLARERLSERTYRQEWLAEFVDDGAGVFRRVREQSTGTPMHEPERGHTYVIGADWGQVEDYTTFSVIDATAKREVWLERFRRVEYTLAIERLRMLWERYKPVMAIPELNSIGRPIIEQLRRADIRIMPFTMSNASKHAVVESLAVALERGELTLLNDPAGIAEMEAFESDRTPGGMVRYGAPSGMHDDIVIARCLAWQGAARPGFKVL